MLFHTNSFRLPLRAPLVQRFERKFVSLTGFQGKLPELGRHLFDPHWNSDSEKKVAEFMLDWLKPNLLTSERPTDRVTR